MKKLFILIFTSLLIMASSLALASRDAKVELSNNPLSVTAESAPTMDDITVVAEARCIGSTPCNACTNCRYCQRCAKDGLTCGTCAGRKKAHH